VFLPVAHAVLLAAYGALQDWDAIYAFAYSHRKDWDARRIPGFFDIDQHPTASPGRRRGWMLASNCSMRRSQRTSTHPPSIRRNQTVRARRAW